MVGARSHGLPAISVPGDHASQPHWAQQLAGGHITICTDADERGRAAVRRIQHDLKQHTIAHIVDLAPNRDDGYDLIDWLIDNPYLAADMAADLAAKLRPVGSRREP